jgi:hypothetical protein
MRVWVICFVVFFGAAELYQWLQGLTLPLPVFIALGGLLAIASNANQWGIFPRSQSVTPSTPPVQAPAPPAAIAQSPNAPVSFTIRKRKSPILPVINKEKGA